MNSTYFPILVFCVFGNQPMRVTMTVLAFELSETQVVNASTLYLALYFSYAASTSLLMFSACSSTYATTLFPLTAYYGFSACCTMCIFAN